MCGGEFNTTDDMEWDMSNVITVEPNESVIHETNAVRLLAVRMAGFFAETKNCVVSATLAGGNCTFVAYSMTTNDATLVTALRDEYNETKTVSIVWADGVEGLTADNDIIGIVKK